MSDQPTFTDFIRRIRAGDEQAALEMVRRYEPLIRRQVRLQLEGRRLCRLFDSMDVCQSVLKSFFFRTAAGNTTRMPVAPARAAAMASRGSHRWAGVRTRRGYTGECVIADGMDEGCMRLLLACRSGSRHPHVVRVPVIPPSGLRMNCDRTGRKPVRPTRQGPSWSVAAEVRGW
jgi:hypothetical protein